MVLFRSAAGAAAERELSAARVHPEHLKHLVEKSAYNAIIKQELKASIPGMKVSERLALVKRLASAGHPGLEAQLDRVYSNARPHKPAFIFAAPSVVGSAADLAGRAGMVVGVESVYPVDPQKRVGTQVRTAHVAADQIRVRVESYSTQTIILEGISTQYPRSEDIYVVVRLDTHVPIVEVLASADPSKKALDAVLTHFGVLGTSEAMKPRVVRFTFAEVDELRARLPMDLLQFDGGDRKKVLGRIAMGSKFKKDERYREPLPATDPRVADHMGPGHRSYDYGLNFTHPDGYVERVEVCFTVASVTSTAKPHIQIIQRASELAVKYVVDSLVAVTHRKSAITGP